MSQQKDTAEAPWWVPQAARVPAFPAPYPGPRSYPGEASAAAAAAAHTQRRWAALRRLRLRISASARGGVCSPPSVRPAGCGWPPPAWLSPPHSAPGFSNLKWARLKAERSKLRLDGSTHPAASQWRFWLSPGLTSVVRWLRKAVSARGGHNLAPPSQLRGENRGRPLPRPPGTRGLFTLALYQRCPE